MKKKYLSGLVILITVILAGYMIVSSAAKNENDGYTMIENSQNKNLDGDNIEEFLKDVEKNSGNSNEKIVKNDDNFNNDKKEIRENEVELDNDKSEGKQDNVQREKTDAKGQFINTNEEESISVFKIDKNLIVGSLTFKEKKNLTKIITSLSMNDYALIMESIKNDGELECVKKVNSILVERLDKEAYEVVKEILEPYINLENL